MAEVIAIRGCSPAPPELIARLNVSRERRGAADGVELDTPLNIDRATQWLKAREPAIEGNGGNAWTYQTIARVRDMGISRDRIEEVIADWNERCFPPWDGDELGAVCDHVFDYAQNEEGCDALAPPEKAFGTYEPEARPADEQSADEEPPARVVAYTEDHAASEFSDRHHHNWRYVTQWGSWLKWDGARWQRDATQEAQHLMRDTCRDLAEEAMGQDLKAAAKTLAKKTTVWSAETLARTDRRHAMSAAVWDTEPFLLNTPSGVIDLKTGRVLRHNSARLITKITGAGIGKVEEGARWLQFLAELTQGNGELQAYLQRIAGYCLTGSVKEHALFFLWGLGGNGKSVFVNALRLILGDYGTSAAPDMFLATAANQHPTDVADLQSARLAASTEIPKNSIWNEAKITRLTGGEPIKARYMRQDFFEYEPAFKLVLSGNNKPHLRTVNEAVRRRMNLIELTAKVAKPDPDLGAKLSAEKASILAWALAGTADWIERGLAPPKCVRDATEAYLASEDEVEEWITDNCGREPDAITPARTLFSDWRDWAQRARYEAGTLGEFKVLLEGKGYFSRKTMTATGIAGLRLKTPDEVDGASEGDEPCGI